MPPTRPIWSAVHHDISRLRSARDQLARGRNEENRARARELEVEMLWTVVVVLLVLWLLGFSLHIGGALIHLLLVVGLVVLVVNLLSGRSG
jgi:Flp pilus assembly protein TadB